MEVLKKMPEFKKPKVLKDSGRIVSEDKRTVLQVQHLEYEVDGNKYPKLNISVHKQDDEGFPQARPKFLNLPIPMSKIIAETILKLQ